MTITDMLPVQSSWIHSAAYSPERHQACIRFRSGLLRWYTVPVSTWQELMTTDSPGTFFRKHIQQQKRFSKNPAPTPFIAKQEAGSHD